jgi:hypothetical protein
MWGEGGEPGLWEGYGCGVIKQGVSDERVPGATYHSKITKSKENEPFLAQHIVGRVNHKVSPCHLYTKGRRRLSISDTTHRKSHCLVLGPHPLFAV